LNYSADPQTFVTPCLTPAPKVWRIPPILPNLWVVQKATDKDLAYHTQYAKSFGVDGSAGDEPSTINKTQRETDSREVFQKFFPAIVDESGYE
jgi:hypothetical protein